MANWIERRAKCERLIREGAFEIWSNLGRDLESCTETYQRLFSAQGILGLARSSGVGDSAVTVSWAPKIPSESQRKKCSVTVTRSEDRFEVAYEGIEPQKKTVFRVIAVGEERLCLSCDGKDVTDLAGQLILEPLLFPAEIESESS